MEVLGTAIETAIENDAQTVLEDVLAGLAGAGYPVSTGGTGSGSGGGSGGGTPANVDNSTDNRCISVDRTKAKNFRFTNLCENKMTVSWCVFAPDNMSWTLCKKAPTFAGSYSEGQTDIGVGKSSVVPDSYTATAVIFTACQTNRGKHPRLTDLAGNGECR